MDIPQPCSELKALILRDGDDVCRLEAFGVLLDGELHFLVRFEPLVTIHVDGGEVNKNIFSFFATDEAEALGRIERFVCLLKGSAKLSRLKNHVKILFNFGFWRFIPGE